MLEAGTPQKAFNDLISGAVWTGMILLSAGQLYATSAAILAQD